MNTAARPATTDQADRAELADLLARHGMWLDERDFANAGAIFTSDAVARTQSGESRGLEALTARARRVHQPYVATQHVTSGVLIEIDGDRAILRANLIAAFVGASTAPRPAVVIGERYRFEARRTPAGWRFSAVEVQPIWRVGEIARTN
jgi:hypothetical protein